VLKYRNGPLNGKYDSSVPGESLSTRLHSFLKYMFYVFSNIKHHYVGNMWLVTHQFSAIAEQYLHSIKAFSVSHSVPIAHKIDVGKRLRGDTAGTSDLN